ncbi:prolactin-4A1-like [Mesocricetus auratus]|uniref:Prolactin-4A1-like n=1 Tax=Mesocricetus auratus TaxID=10036 RepID=A0A1U7Q3R6_MESAU|nr:prolactin-4A1-like [Mesocricetus auratus]
MHISLTSQWSSLTGTLLLMLVSMVHGENMTSTMNVKMLNISYRSPFGDMLDEAIKLSQGMNHLISKLSTHFNRFYANDRGFHKRIIRCHTSALSRPENKEQAQNTELEVLLKLAHNLLQAWVNPLYHLWAEMGDKLGYTPPDLTKALEIKSINRRLIEDMKNIIQKANYALEENVNTPAWSELASLHSTNRDTRYFAFYKLFHCLGNDSRDVEMYLKLVKCQMVQRNC